MKTSLDCFAKIYVDSIKDLELNFDWSPDTLNSGWTCMIFMLSLPAKLKREQFREIDWVDVYDRTIAYIKLYLLVDHYVDSPTISPIDKKEFLIWLQDDERIASTPFQEIILEQFSLLVQDKITKEYMKTLIEITVAGIKTQQTKTEFSDYFDASWNKGGYTVLCGTRLIYKDQLNMFTDEDLIYLGGCTQLLDDLIDASADMKEGINTLCTHAIRTEGYLDKVAKLLYRKLRALPEHFHHYQRMINEALRYIVAKSKHYTYLLKLRLNCSAPSTEIQSFKKETERSLRKAYKVARNGN